MSRNILHPILRSSAAATPYAVRAVYAARSARLVHRQRPGCEQQQQGGTGVEHGGWAPQSAQIATGQCRLCRYAYEGPERLHVQQ
jgi:hypothetical protein